MKFHFVMAVAVASALGACGSPDRLSDFEPIGAVESALEWAPNTLYDPESGSCAAVTDARKQANAGRQPPNLPYLRRTPDGVPNRGPRSLEVPGGIGAGVTYGVGALTARTGATLYT